MVFLKNKQGQNQFKFELLTDEKFEEAFNCFIQGYLKSHPIYNALKIEEQEVKHVFYDKLKQALQDRPYQQLIAIDILNQNKIIGVYFMGHLVQYPQKQQNSQNETNEKNKFKNYIDDKLMNSKFIQEYEKKVIEQKNPHLYQEAYVSILPEYQNIQGLFQTFTQLQFYISPRMGVKAFIDKCYNIKMAEYPMRYFDGVLLNEIDLQNEGFQGEKIFQNQKYICAKLVKTHFESKLAKKYYQNDDPNYAILFQKYINKNQDQQQQQQQQQQQSQKANL